MARATDAEYVEKIFEKWLDNISDGEETPAIEACLNVVRNAPTLTPPNDPLTMEELREMERKRNLNQSMETLWADLGKRSGLEDIENFGEIFQVARRSGGNLKEIIQSTADNITRKTETRREIEISLAAKKMEQKVMSAVPFFILAYVDLGSPEFLEGLYHNKLGIFIMTACLGLYLAAFFWGRRIVEIEV